MSTKTTFKRVALIAVVALGLGGLSTVPASAGTAQAMVESISLAQVTAAPAVNSAVAVNFGAAIGDVTGAADGDNLDFKGYLSAYPAGGFAGVTASATAEGTDGELTGVTAAVGAQANTADTASGAVYTVDLTDASALSDNDPSSEGNITASATQGAGKFSFTPTVAGAYTLSVWFDQDADGVVDIGEAVQTINLTVAGAGAFSQVLSTSFLDDASSYDATVDEEVRVSKTAATNGASIMVTLKDVNGAVFDGARVQADVSGPGYVDVVTGGTAYADATARTDYVDLASDVNEARVHVTADGTAGKSTITITIKNATTLATLGTFTETMYFYGTVATLTATKNFNVARANVTERGCAAATGCISDGTLDETPFVLIVAKDSEGNLVPGAALANAVTAKITDSAVIAASTVAAVTEEASATTAGVTTDPNGLGYFNASVAGNVAATSGSKTTVVYRTLLADGVTYVTSNAVEISIGGSAATESLTFDKASYEAGEGMTVTRTCKDASGNACYDGSAAGAVTFSKAVSGSVAADIYLDGKVSSDNSRGAKTVFAPVAGGTFTGTMTGKVAAATADIVTSATVASATDAAVNGATDAANEATDAANAATDAALAAADAADAATAAAQDASDAVAALSATVAKLVASLKAQITSLTNLVIKIQKKVRA